MKNVINVAKKYYLYLKLTAATCFRNRTRIVLTLIGISIGLVIFLLGNAAVSGYMNRLYRSADAFAEDAYLIMGYDQDVDWFTEKLSGTADFSALTYEVLGSYAALPTYTYQEHFIRNTVRVIGAEQEMLSGPIPSHSSESASGVSLCSSSLIYGRDLTKEDISEQNPVCLLECSTAMFLFQTENAVGQKLHLESDKGYLDLEVIGVISDNYPTKQTVFDFNKRIKDNDTEIIRNEADIYIPISVVQNIAQNCGTETQPLRIVRPIDSTTANLAAEIDRIRSEAVRLSKAVNVKSKAKMMQEISETQKEFNIIKTIVSVFLFTLSGFIILTVFLFAIKERVYEIGVRRAVGASSFSILAQFMIEGILISALAAGVSIAVSIFLSNFLTYFIRDINYIDFTMILTKELLVGTAAISVLQGIIFSFIPAMIASGIRPTEAIRWD